MAVSLSGTASWPVRMGKYILEANRVCTAIGSALDTGISGISGQFASNDQIAIDGLFGSRDSYRTVHSNYLNDLRSRAITTTIEQVNRDTTLTSKTLYNALAELIRQFENTSDSLNRPTISATVTTASSNQGDTTLHASTTSNKGVPLDMVLPETLTVQITADVNTGGTQYGEPMSVTGQPVRAFDAYNWPGGSGANTTMTVVDGAVTTKLTDGSWQNWQGTGNNTPSNWTVVSGASTITRGSSPARTSQSYSLAITSDGSSTTTIKQQVTLLPQTVYGYSAYAKINTVDATGTVRFRLVDGSGTVVSDDAGTNNSTSVGVNGGGGIAATYTQIQTFWRTPRQLPSQVFVEISVTTPPTSGRIINLSLSALAEATISYQGGPYLIAFSKTDYGTRLDSFTVAVANNLGTTALIPSLDRFFNLRQLGLAFPSAASETVSDSVIG